MKGVWIILSFVALLLNGCGKFGKSSSHLDDMATIAAAIEDYESDGVPLTKLNNLTVYATLVKGNSGMKYHPTALSKAAGQLLDPWERPLRFARGENGIVYVISAGPDGFWGLGHSTDNLVISPR